MNVNKIIINNILQDTNTIFGVVGINSTSEMYLYSVSMTDIKYASNVKKG
jgi:hypothetical protein